MSPESPTICPCCGARCRVLQECPELLLACTACDWRQWPVPSLRNPVNPFVVLGWLALGLLPIATPWILFSRRQGYDSTLGFWILAGSAICCLLGGFGLAALTGGGQVQRLIVGLGASVALASVCLALGTFGACASVAIRL